MHRFPPLPMDDLFDAFPVPVEVIAKHYYGIEIVERRLPDSIGGILHKFEGRSYLYLNSRHSHERQRYTVAHEIAHHRLHPIGVYASGLGASSTRERACDMAAADMLMPKWKVRQLIGEQVPFVEMARCFGVSKEAMRRRLEEVAKEEQERTNLRAAPRGGATNGDGQRKGVHGGATEAVSSLPVQGGRT